MWLPGAKFNDLSVRNSARNVNAKLSDFVSAKLSDSLSTKLSDSLSTKFNTFESCPWVLFPLKRRVRVHLPVHRGVVLHNITCLILRSLIWMPPDWYFLIDTSWLIPPDWSLLIDIPFYSIFHGVYFAVPQFTLVEKSQNLNWPTDRESRWIQNTRR